MRTEIFTKIMAIAAVALLVALSGCASTRSAVTEFDAEGNIVRTTETSESVIKTVTASTQGKTVVMWEEGWAAYISVSSGTIEDPTPHGKIFCGKINHGAVSMLPNQQGARDIARIIRATKSDVSVGLTEGVSVSSGAARDADEK